MGIISDDPDPGSGDVIQADGAGEAVPTGASARDGRDEGLRSEGGQQQLSPLWTMLFAFLALIVGYGLVEVTL